MSLVVRSPAKINWTLRVLGRRADGYHEIESLMSAVSLYDELTFTPKNDSRFVLACDDPSIPTDDRNLILRAAAIAGRGLSAPAGFDCRLTKRIPAGGGLGGGSSNAAATLLALNQLWSLGWSRRELMAAAARVGSDVSFFILGGTAIMSGRGEIVRPAKLPWRGWIVLLMPGLSVPTALVYHAWRPASEPLPPKPNGSAFDAVKWMRMAYNMLEEPAMLVCPPLRGILGRAAELVGRPVRISGSGSTLYTAFDTQAEARTAADLLNRELQLRTDVVQPVEET